MKWEHGINSVYFDALEAKKMLKEYKEDLRIIKRMFKKKNRV